MASECLRALSMIFSAFSDSCWFLSLASCNSFSLDSAFSSAMIFSTDIFSSCSFKDLTSVVSSLLMPGVLLLVLVLGEKYSSTLLWDLLALATFL